MKNQIFKSFPLVGGAEAYVNMQTGKGKIIVPDISDSQMGVRISHVIDGGEDDLNCGSGARLNLHETLVKEENGYIYTDGMGEKHTVTESFYYIDENGQKQAITDKSLIVIDPNGMMSYSNGTYNVYREEKTDNGLRVTTILDGISNIKNYEQRADEQKQLEEQIKAYENAILDFVVADENGVIKSNCTTVDDVIETVKSKETNEYCLTKSEAISLNSAETQRMLLLKQISQNGQISSYYTHQKNDIVDEINIIGRQKSLLKEQSDINKQQFLALFDEFNVATESDKASMQNKVQDYVIVDNVQGDVKYTLDVFLDNEENSAIYFVNEQNQRSSALDSDNYQTELDSRLSGNLFFTREQAITYKSLVIKMNEYNNSYDMISFQKEMIDPSDEANEYADDQKENIEEQISYIKNCSNSNVEKLCSYYKECCLAKSKLDTLKLQIPVCFISNENSVKGFNAEGNLVVIYGKNNNYVAIDYEQYYSEGIIKNRIARLYNEKEQQIKLSYDKATGMLAEIVNSLGERTEFLYKNGSVLETIKTVNNHKFEFSHQIYDEFSDYKVSYDNEYNIIKYIDNEVNYIYNYSYVDSVSHNSIIANQNLHLMNKYTILIVDANNSIVLDEKQNGAKYSFIENNCTEQREISNGKVTSAAKYEYTGENLTRVIYPKESCLYVSNDDFVFVEDYSKTFAYDEFDRVTSETAGWITVSDTVKKQSVTSYTYDANDRPVKLYTVVNTKKNGSQLSTTENYVQLFEYDKNGQLLCKKSYKEGIELIEGVSIEEHIYDNNGYEIKSFTYNSLDPSSKLYKECEVDENGKVTGELDQCGINKIAYKDNSVIHPNGSIHSYGVSTYDGNSAITISTENGEENSIQRLYTNGYLTRVISGDNVYDYTYDYKGRVTNIKIDGEDYVNYTYEYSETMQAERVIATYSDGTVITDSKDPMYSDVSISDGTISNYISKAYDKEKLTEITLLGSNGPENKTAFEYNQQGQVTEAARSVFNFDLSDFNENYKEVYSYDENGNIIQRLINFKNPRGDATTYEYDEDTKKLKSMSYANGLIQLGIKTDCLGRNRGKDVFLLNNKIYSEDITYLKQGDHATVLPLTISYGKRIGEDFVIKANIK